MIKQMTTLLRVKQLKEEQAFRAVNAKRAQVAAAKTELEAARRLVAESAATLPMRENAIWAEIMLKVIDLGDVDTVKGRVVALEREHEKLVNAAERAAHVLARLETELSEAVEAHRQAMKNRDKYVELTDQMKTEHAALVEFKEEAEVEDLFSTRRKRTA